MSEDKHNPQHTPPVTTKWRNVYVFVALFLVLQIVLYYVFMNSFE